MTNMLPALTGSNVIYGMGMMEMGMTMSYEQLLTDAEIVRMTRRILQGIPVNQDTMALDVIKAVGPANNYLAHKHTRKYMRQELSTTQYTERNLGKERRYDDDRSYQSEGNRHLRKLQAGTAS